MKIPKPIKELPPEVMRLANSGLELVAAVVSLLLLGYWVDYQFGTGPWGLLTGAIVGIVGGLYNMVRKAVHETFQPAPPKENQASETQKNDKRNGR